MKILSELKIHNIDHASQSDIKWYLREFGHLTKDATIIKTNIDGLELAVNTPGNKNFIVLLVLNDSPIGYVELLKPNSGGLSFADNVKTPHSGLLKEYQGKGYMSSVYKWFLDSGNILVTGHEQTPMSNVLWKGLSNTYPVVFFDSNKNFIRKPTFKQASSRDVRMAILGKGQSEKDIFR